MASRHWIAVMASLGTLGCGLLDVSSPLRVSADSLENPALAPVLVNSAIGDFECALGNYIAASANVGDEFYTSATAANSGWDLRLRATGLIQVAGCAEGRGTPGVGNYVGLQRARFQAEDTYARLQRFGTAIAASTSSEFMATMAAYAGYAYTLFGEGYCSSAFDLGPEVSREAVLGIADERFTTALTLAPAGNADLVNLARVGRARVRLNQGRLGEAAADASLVPANYVKYATYSSDSPRRQNQVYVWNNFAFWATIDPRYRNLTVGGVPDPRVPVRDAGRNGVDAVTRLWVQSKYPTEGSPIPMATWEEAQLIIAEAEGGQSAVDVVNRLRTRAGLPATFSSVDPVAIRDTVREERRRQLFLQGHRLGDMLRWGLPFDTGINGRNTKNQLYGDMTCIPLPKSETDNNPNFPH